VNTFVADFFSSTVPAMVGLTMIISSIGQLWVFGEFVAEELRFQGDAYCIRQ